jgi:topoisomerase-4 subunit B
VVQDESDAAAEEKLASETVNRLMGRKPELRFAFIQERARFMDDTELDV